MELVVFSTIMPITSLSTVLLSLTWAMEPVVDIPVQLVNVPIAPYLRDETCRSPRHRCP
jgi:hypothetical protein